MTTQYYKNIRLTHMTQLESFLWVKFLEEKDNDYFNFEYDVHLEKPVNLPTEMPEEYKKNALKLSSLRIDAVAEQRDSIFVCEIRPDAKASAIGNLILYKFLYNLQYKPKKVVKMLLITNTYDTAVELMCRAIGIVYKVYWKEKSPPNPP